MSGLKFKAVLLICLYPAEGGLFDTLLLGTGLYSDTKKGLLFKEPTLKNDPAGIYPLEKAKKRKLANPLREDKCEIDLDDLYGKSKVCLTCHK